MKWTETKKIGEVWKITMYPETEREVQLIRRLRHCTRMSVTLGYNKRTPWGEVLTGTQEWTEKRYQVRKVSKPKPRKRGEVSTYELAKMLVSGGKAGPKRKKRKARKAP